MIRQHKAMYLGDEEPSGRILSIGLADCALVSGASRVELLRLPESWTGVLADADWITPNVQQHNGRSLEHAFQAMIPLRGGRPNQIRFEVVVAAFSTNVSVKSGDSWIAIAGDLPPRDVRDRVTESLFAVAFRAKADS